MMEKKSLSTGQKQLSHTGDTRDYLRKRDGRGLKSALLFMGASEEEAQQATDVFVADNNARVEVKTSDVA